MLIRWRTWRSLTRTVRHRELRHPDQFASAFEKHKDILLAILLDAYEHGPKSEPFDADTAWNELRSLARLYFGVKWERLQQRAAADRRERLSKFAKSLRKAHRLFDEAKRDEFIMYLHCRYGTHQERPIEPVHPNDELEKVLAALSTLEAATCFALGDDFYTPSPPGSCPITVARSAISCDMRTS